MNPAEVKVSLLPIRTHAELDAWTVGAEEEFGDPSLPVGILAVRYQQTIVTAGDCDDITASWCGGSLRVDAFGDAMPLRVEPDGPIVTQVDDGVSPLAMECALTAFGIVQLGPGTWMLSPSLNVPGMLHVFVIVCDVPSPAPWERPVISPGAAA